jgi:hypothetical protein
MDAFILKQREELKTEPEEKSNIIIPDRICLAQI